MRLGIRLAGFLIALATQTFAAERSRYHIDEAIRVARARNPDIAIAEKKLEAARNGIVEARAGQLPSVVSSGRYARRERSGDSNLRPEDYNANIRVIESLYSGGATGSRIAIARLNVTKAEAELAAVVDRVTMEVRLAFYELLLNQDRIHVREESVAVLEQELKTQQERFSTGTVG